MSSSPVCNHTRDKQIGLPLRGRPILLSLVWLQTELDSTQSYYHYLFFGSFQTFSCRTDFMLLQSFTLIWRQNFGNSSQTLLLTIHYSLVSFNALWPHRLPTTVQYSSPFRFAYASQAAEPVTDMINIHLLETSQIIYGQLSYTKVVSNPLHGNWQAWKVGFQSSLKFWFCSI